MRAGGRGKKDGKPRRQVEVAEEGEGWAFDPLGLGEAASLPLQEDEWGGFARQALAMSGGGKRSSGAAAAVEDKSIEFGDFFKGKLPSKFLTLLGLLALSRVGVYIPLWGVDRAAFAAANLGDGTLLSTLDTLSGGGIGRLGLFSLGIVPYINAQIVFQLLGTLREGPISAVAGLTLGSMAVVWIGDKITDLKLGNGTSVLIYTNIVSYLPATLGRTAQQALTGANEAERRIPINYASQYKFSARGLNRSAYLPFKASCSSPPCSVPAQHSLLLLLLLLQSYCLCLSVNSSGVMPIIFSSSLLAAPASLARFTGSAALQSAAVALYPGGALYLPTNVALIAFFNYFYTFLQLDPADVSDQLKRQGASIPNTRPGKATASYITNTLTAISVPGSAFLGFLAAAPALVEGVTHLTAFRGFAGTSVLILVGCATDTARKVQAELISQKYKTIELYDLDTSSKF
eukprot:jgi/Mesen1/1556/ME000134S00676